MFLPFDSVGVLLRCSESDEKTASVNPSDWLEWPGEGKRYAQVGGMASGERMTIGRKFGSDVFGRGGLGGGEHDDGNGVDGMEEEVIEYFFGDGLGHRLYSGSRFNARGGLSNDEALDGMLLEHD